MTARRTSDVIDVLENLGLTVKAVRLARGKSLRQVAKEAGMASSTVTRIEAGEDCALSNAVALLRWLA